MSTINKKPFIKTLVEDMTAGQIATLQLLVDGSGDQNALLRTMNIKPVGDRTHITAADKGIHLCDLEVNFSLFKGYLIYTDHYCVLIHFTDSQVLGMFNIDLNDLTKFATVSEELSVLELRNELNDTRESEDADVLETVMDALNTGDLKIVDDNIDSGNEASGKVLMSNGEGGAVWEESSTYKTFPTSWPTTGTTKAFCDAINADANAVSGMAFLGSLSVTDGPFVGNGDTVVEIMPGPSGTSKAIHLIMTSGNVKPYHWEYTYWNNGSNYSGWVAIGGGMEVLELSGTEGYLTDEQYDVISSNPNSVVLINHNYHVTLNSEDSAGYYFYRIPSVSPVYGLQIEYYKITVYKTKTEGFGYRWIRQTEQVGAMGNVNLAGTESDLTSLQIGYVKYKIPQGVQVVELNSSSGTLTDAEFAILSGEHGCIKYRDVSESRTYLFYKSFTQSNGTMRYDAVAGYAQSSVVTTYFKPRYFTITSGKVYDYNRSGVLSDGAIPLVTVNPPLSGSEPEFTSLQVGNGKYKTPALSNTDGVTFSFTSNTDYADSALAAYASYNRIDKFMEFVVACTITKNTASNTAIELGKFANIPATLFNKLVPTIVGTGSYLEQGNTAAFDDEFTSVSVPTSIVKGTNNDISIRMDPTNLVQGTRYHIRKVFSFLLTDNLSGVDHILDNNSWAVIEEVAKAGQTTNYWAVGDEKTDLGTDGNTRTFRIVDIENDGSIVFEQVELEETSMQWNPSTNVDSDSCYNDYYISNMRNTHLPATLLKYSSALQGVITTTNVKVATNGNNGTILTLTDKLFLEAEKEIWTSSSYSRQEEWNALSTYAYYISHTLTADHIKYRPNGGSASYWWLRSPGFGDTVNVCGVYGSGYASSLDANSSYRFAPCFRIGTAQTGGLAKRLAEYSWAEIDTIAQAGNASNYWAIGDTKTDTGTDGYDRTFRIVNMDSRGIVFEQVGLEGTDGSGATGVAWDANNSNNYYQSDMRNTVLPSVLLKYSSGLQSVITTTNVKVATAGNDSTLLTLTDKLFLEAEKEVGLSTYSVSAEQSALSTYAYYVTHNTRDDRKKYIAGASSASNWWLRSPGSGFTSSVCDVNVYGNANGDDASNAFHFAPCFRIGLADTGGLGPYIPVSSTLNDNSWSTIKSVCEAGNAANYWSVGDTKTDTGTDNVTRTFRIVDMSGLYGKHVVFEQMNCEGNDGQGSTGVAWDADNINDYAASDMNLTILPSIVAKYSSDLQAELTNTTVKVAENGTSSTIVDVTNKLFLEAEKEVGLSTYSVGAEQSALTTYSYYVTHNQNSDRVKRRILNNAAVTWWLRSPSFGANVLVLTINNSGAAYEEAASQTQRFSPCFAF